MSGEELRSENNVTPISDEIKRKLAAAQKVKMRERMRKAWRERPTKKELAENPALKTEHEIRAAKKNQKQVEDAALKAWVIFENDPMAWGATMFPNHFSMASPKFHYEMVYTAMGATKISIASPRGSAKSTLLCFLYLFHQIMFHRKKFILLVSNTFKKAAMHLDTIKKELAENQKINRIHPKVKLLRDAEGDTIFQHPDGFTTMVLCKGVDQIGSVRGVKYGADRPDLILCDDLEDDELVKNPERRLDLQNAYDQALIPAGAHNACQYIVIGTIFHDDSQMAKLVSADYYRDYVKLFYRAHLDADTDHESSLWPQKWSLEFLHQLRKENPNVYAKEYQNDPVAGTNTRFKKADFRYWKLEGGDALLTDSSQDGGDGVRRFPLRSLRAAIACDLAWKEKRDSDSSVLMPGYITPDGDILISDYITKKGMRPDETAEHLFSLVSRLESQTGGVVPIGFEKAMLENVTQWLLKREMRERNKYLLTQELVWDADKNTRIETRLQPRYAQHVIYHRAGMGDLEHQLERFPSGTHDDLIDALQGLVQLLQVPKARAATPPEEDHFMRMRQTIIDRKNPKPSRGRYNGTSRNPFPYIVSPLEH